jgi:uncharacterized protein
MERGFRRGGLDCCVGLSKKVDVGAVLAAGRPLGLDEEVAVPAFGSYRFPKPARVVLEVRRLGSGVEVDGTIDVAWAGECDRCLGEVGRPLHIEVSEQFSPSDDPMPFADNNVLEGQLLDVADLVRQLIDSALPIALLCSEDCPGLCAQCGKPRRGAGCTCPTLVER